MSKRKCFVSGCQKGTKVLFCEKHYVSALCKHCGNVSSVVHAAKLVTLGYCIDFTLRGDAKCKTSFWVLLSKKVWDENVSIRPFVQIMKRFKVPKCLYSLLLNWHISANIHLRYSEACSQCNSWNVKRW